MCIIFIFSFADDGCNIAVESFQTLCLKASKNANDFPPSMDLPTTYNTPSNTLLLMDLFLTSTSLYMPTKPPPYTENQPLHPLLFLHTAILKRLCYLLPHS